MHHLNSTFDSIGQIAAVLLNRHWLIGFENVLITASLGSALVSLISKIGGKDLNPVTILLLKRLVLLVSLFKGALYFLLGEEHTGRHPGHPVVGFQFPDPRDVFNLLSNNPWSIWNPAPMTVVVTTALLTYTVVILLFRVCLMASASRKVSNSKVEVSSEIKAQLTKELELAAKHIGQHELSSVEIIVCSKISSPSPFVLGFWEPCIVIRDDMLGLLIEKGWLRAVLSHELMHIVRNDHVTRWLQLWLEDITLVTFITRRIGSTAFSLEEKLCDCGAIKDTLDAEALAMAIASAHRMACDHRTQSILPYLVSETFPSLKGSNSNAKQGIIDRLEHIKVYATFITGVKAYDRLITRAAKTGLLVIAGVLLFLSLYLKYYFFIAP